MTDQDREEFLQQHGQKWSIIINDPAFNAGMIHLSLKATEEIRLLTDDQITHNSVVILADLRGRMKHEFDLLSLPIPPEEPMQELIPEYVNQVEEFAQEVERQTKPRKK